MWAELVAAFSTLGEQAFAELRELSTMPWHPF